MKAILYFDAISLYGEQWCAVLRWSYAFLVSLMFLDRFASIINGGREDIWPHGVKARSRVESSQVLGNLSQGLDF